MHFDSATLDLAKDKMPKWLLALVEFEQVATESVASSGLARRCFLKMGVVSGFALGAYPLFADAQPAAPAGLKPFEQPSAFVRIAKDGSVTLYRLEFGQGVLTASPMCLVEELDADWSKVYGEHGDAAAYVAPAFGIHLTSTACRSSWLKAPRHAKSRSARTIRCFAVAPGASHAVKQVTLVETWGSAPRPPGAVHLLNASRGQAMPFDGIVLTTVFGPKWRMLLIGAGQLSQAVAQMLDFEVLVCDPRDEYVTTWRMDGITRAMGMPDDAMRALAPDAPTAIVALTHAPKLDDMALLEALVSDAFYVGALGSKRNQEARKQRPAEHFDVSPEALARLQGPVGLALGAKTPAKIAVFTIAQIVQVKNAASQGQSIRESGA